VQKALIIDGSLQLPRGGNIGGSFTFNETRDNHSFNCCIAITSVFTPVPADPREMSWGPSSNDFRHKLVLFGSTPEVFGGRFSVRVIGQSGSAVVGHRGAGHQLRRRGAGRVVRQRQRPGVPVDPATPGSMPRFAVACRRCYDNPNNLVRDYLRENLGTIAGRNAVRNPFVTQIDVRYSQKLPSVRGQRPSSRSTSSTSPACSTTGGVACAWCRVPTRRCCARPASMRPRRTGATR
jgi:hypothetical protein